MGFIDVEKTRVSREVYGRLYLVLKKKTVQIAYVHSMMIALRAPRVTQNAGEHLPEDGFQQVLSKKIPHQKIGSAGWAGLDELHPQVITDVVSQLGSTSYIFYVGSRRRIFCFDAGLDKRKARIEQWRDKPLRNLVFEFSQVRN